MEKMTCYGCSTILTDANLRLCDKCRAGHARLEEPYLAGYVDWKIKFVLSKKGIGHKIPFADSRLTGKVTEWLWYRVFVKTKGNWREV